MPATVFPALHGSNVVGSERPKSLPKYAVYKEVQSAHELLIQSTGTTRLGLSEKDYLQSSFEADYEDELRTIHTAENGFLHSCVRAYFEHLHLVLRPEDIWLAILTQLNMYIRKNAEQLRSQFVAHGGKMFLELGISGSSKTDGKPCTLGFASFARRMVKKMQEKIIDKDLSEWVIPDFSTTTEHDKVVASIVFMGSMSKYFDFGGKTGCGLPSVTLLGTQEDWEHILEKIDKIPSLGDEPTQWHELLVPVLKSFVETFKRPSSAATKDFWQKILHHHKGGSGQSNHYSGWLTAFSFWNDKGDCLNQYKEPAGLKLSEKLKLDGVSYPRINCQKLVQGHISVDVRINDEYNHNGIYMTTMIAGSVGIEVSASGDHGEEFDTVAPATGWWVYLKDESKPKPAGEAQTTMEKDDDAQKQAPIAESRRKMWSGMMDKSEVETEIAIAA